MRNKIRWGIMSTAKIARTHVIPAIIAAQNAELVAVASRNKDAADAFAEALDIPLAYGSYEELINSDEVDCIYNPLPNHLHAEWTIKAINVGKHVLCEKPMAISLDEVNRVIDARNAQQVKVGEAFMVRSSTQWKKVKSLVDDGLIGKIKSIQCFFSYYNDDPKNIRNMYPNGGGGLWDIGCYPITFSRYITGEEPTSVTGHIDYDEILKVDQLASAIMVFPSCTSTFTVSTQTQVYQRILVYGTEKILEIQIPFNAPIADELIVKCHDGDITENSSEIIPIAASNQYEKMVNEFSDAILNDTEVPVTVEDAYLNVKTILGIFKADKEKTWVKL